MSAYDAAEAEARAGLRAETKVTWKYLDRFFQSQPIYLIWFQDLPRGHLDARLVNIDGFVTANGYHRFRSHLVERGIDQGPGPVMLLNAEIADDRPCVLATMVHEAAHLLQMAAEGSTVEQRYPTTKTDAGWHDSVFTRAAVHLHHRATKLLKAETCNIDQVLLNKHRRTEAIWYWVALQKELNATPYDASIVQLLRTTPPPAFVARCGEMYPHHDPEPKIVSPVSAPPAIVPPSKANGVSRDQFVRPCGSWLERQETEPAGYYDRRQWRRYKGLDPD